MGVGVEVWVGCLVDVGVLVGERVAVAVLSEVAVRVGVGVYVPNCRIRRGCLFASGHSLDAML